MLIASICWSKHKGKFTWYTQLDRQWSWEWGHASDADFGSMILRVWQQSWECDSDLGSVTVISRVWQQSWECNSDLGSVTVISRVWQQSWVFEGDLKNITQSCFEAAWPINCNHNSTTSECQGGTVSQWSWYLVLIPYQVMTHTGTDMEHFSCVYKFKITGLVYLVKACTDVFQAWTN